MTLRYQLPCAEVQRLMFFIKNNLFFGIFLFKIPVDHLGAEVYLQSVTTRIRNNADASGNDAVQQGSVKKIVPKTPEIFTYDNDGNVLSDGRWNYTWDGENRLNRIESASSAPSADKKRIDFVYDGQSRRVSKKSYTWNGTAWVLADSRRFLYDQFNLLAEINDAGAVIDSYAWGTDLSGSIYGAGGVGGLLINGASTASATSFPCYDANGNILAYVSNTGSVTAQFEYGPFGDLLRATGNPPSAFGFSTKYRDSETGLNYYSLRHYSTQIGRFINRDPIEESGGINLYGFCTNDGVNFVDPLGLLKVWGSISLSVAKAHWQGGTQEDVQISFDLVDTKQVKVKDFPDVKKKLDEWKNFKNQNKGCYEDSQNFTDARNPFSPSGTGNATTVLGSVTLKFLGDL